MFQTIIIEALKVIVKVTRIFFILLLLSSCSSIKIYSSSPTLELSMEDRENYTKEIEYKVDKEFFFFGMIPTTHKLDIAESFKEAGVDSAAEVKVIKERKTKNMLWAFFTFGLYTPESYVIKAKTYKYNKYGN